MKDPAGLINALDEPLFELNLDGKVISATNAARALVGDTIRSPEALDVLGDWEFASVVAMHDRARFAKVFKRVADGITNTQRLELDMIAFANGNQAVLPTEVKIGAVRAALSKPSSVAVWLRDLSIEKANETAATVQGTYLLDLVENVAVPCVVENTDGRIEMLNATFCRLFAIRAAPQSLIGTSCATLFAAASLATVKQFGPLYRSLDAAKGSKQRDELNFLLATGEAVTQTSIAVDGNNGVAGRLHLFHLTAHRTDAPSEAPSAGMITNQMFLIDKITHELTLARESASQALYRAEQLDLPSQLLEQFRRVETASLSAFDAVAGLLQFSPVDRMPDNTSHHTSHHTSLTLESAPFKLRENVAMMIAGIAGCAQQRRAQLRVRVEQDVPERLTGDGARLMQALRHLLDCAIAAAPTADAVMSEGATEIVLTVSSQYSANGHTHLTFSVEQMVRSGTVKDTALPPSASMQLALSRQIVRALVGDQKSADHLEVQQRKLGVSYQFTATFPFDNTKLHHQRPYYIALTGLPVLIVSESAAERRALAELTKRWRMMPREADNADVAIQLLSRFAQDGSTLPLVITSNRLTTQDGFLLAFRIKHHPALRQTSVIMLATEGKPGDAVSCRENGISAYLRQPALPQQLNEAITAVIGAQDDAEMTSTLITRHSLREQKKAAVLIIDASRNKISFVAATLKRKGYRTVLVGSAQEAFEAMVQEQFDVIVVDPKGVGFAEGADIVNTLRSHIGESRRPPTVLLASESPISDANAYDGMVLKPFVKDSILNTVADLLFSPAGKSSNQVLHRSRSN